MPTIETRFGASLSDECRLHTEVILDDLAALEHGPWGSFGLAEAVRRYAERTP